MCPLSLLGAGTGSYFGEAGLFIPLNTCWDLGAGTTVWPGIRSNIWAAEQCRKKEIERKSGKNTESQWNGLWLFATKLITLQLKKITKSAKWLQLVDSTVEGLNYVPRLTACIISKPKTKETSRL